MSGKYSENLLDYAKKSATDALRTTSNRVIRKTGDFIGNKIANGITKVLRSTLQNNSETITNEHDKIPKERYISPKKRQKIIRL